MNGSNAFRFSGANFYEGCLSEKAKNGSQNFHYTSPFQQLDGLSTIKEMGGTVVRCHSAGISVGNSLTSLTLFPTLASLTNTTQTPTQAMFTAIDNFIYQAGLLGLRLIIPLTDDHQYYHGGLYTFLGWRGYNVSGTNPDATPFYTNSTVLGDFKKYITALLTHVNQYNSLAYKDDPTILAWETGNELQTIVPPSTWTSAIATHIKSTANGGVGASQLVMDGTGLSQWPTAALSLSNVDIYTTHYYPPNIGQMQSDAQTITNANKVFVPGEYDWTQNYGGTAVMTQDTTTVPSGGGSKSLKIVVSQAASQSYFDQLQQTNNINITSGHTYTLSFFAKSLSPYYTSSLPLDFGLQQNGGNYAVYTPVHGNTNNLTPWETPTTSAWTQYTFSFQSPVTDSNVILYFNLGLKATTTWLDLVSITDNAAPGTNLVSNPSFENSTISPWYNNNTSIDTLSSFLSAIEACTTTTTGIVAGDLFWNVYPHDDAYGYVLDTEVFTLYYPGDNLGTGVTASDMKQRTTYLRNHAYAMRNITVPASSTPVAPTITSVTPSGNNKIVAWQGVVGGMTYTLERSTDGVSYSVLSTTLTDALAPYQDTTATLPSVYRVKAFNRDSVVGPYSAVFGVLASSYGVLSVSPLTLSAGNNALVIANSGIGTATWSVSCSGVTFTPSSGTLASGASQTVTIAIAGGGTVSQNIVANWVCDVYGKELVFFDGVSGKYFVFSWS